MDIHRELASAGIGASLALLSALGTGIPRYFYLRNPANAGKAQQRIDQAQAIKQQSALNEQTAGDPYPESDHAHLLEDLAIINEPDTAVRQQKAFKRALIGGIATGTLVGLTTGGVSLAWQYIP